jgi:hypothetical protein
MHEVENLFEGRNLELAIKACVGWSRVGNALAGTQCLELGECEIFREPSRYGRPVDHLCSTAGGELGMLGNVRGAAYLVLVTGDEHAVLCHDEIRLDVVGAILDRYKIRGKRVFRDITGRAAMAYNNHGTRRGGPIRLAAIARMHDYGCHDQPENSGTDTQYRHRTC